MSDADEGFDKEAEREKLREKYERDQQKRESTQKMSELLLQGATMTNQHCDDCGSPMFRYEGQTFCPSCQGGTQGEKTGPRGDAADANAEQAAPQNSDATPDQGTSAADETSADTASEPAETTAEPAAPESTTATPEPSTTGPRGDRQSEPSAETPNRAGSAGERTGTEHAGTERSDQPSPASGTADDDIAAARASVKRTLADLAARAERSNDAAHTKELLEATREAAETLRELNRLE